MKFATLGLSFLLGFGGVAAVNTAHAAGPADLCGTGARILCDAPKLPGKPPVKRQVRRDGPVARTPLVHR